MLKEGKLLRPENKCESHNELNLPKILELWTVLMGFCEHAKMPSDLKKAGHYLAALPADKWISEKANVYWSTLMFVRIYSYTSSPVSLKLGMRNESELTARSK